MLVSADGLGVMRCVVAAAPPGDDVGVTASRRKTADEADGKTRKNRGKIAENTMATQSGFSEPFRLSAPCHSTLHTVSSLDVMTTRQGVEASRARKAPLSAGRPGGGRRAGGGATSRALFHIVVRALSWSRRAGATTAHTAGHASASASVLIATSSTSIFVMSAAAAAPCCLARASPGRAAIGATAARRLGGARVPPADLPHRGSGARAWSRLTASKARPRRGLLTRGATESDEAFPYPLIDRTAKKLTLHMGDSALTIETGRIGRQANGAVLVTEGETVMYATICAGREITADGGFVPLTVNYQERFSAVGKTAGGYRKRDGGIRENETLVGRLVDRPLRPMIPKGWAYDTQILQWVLSYDGVRSTDAMAITAASAVAAISDVPLKKPVAGVRVGWLPGSSAPLVNPTREQMKTSRLDLVLAGTEDAVMMIEGFGDFLTVDEMLCAIEMGHETVAQACREIAKWAKEVGREKRYDKVIVAPEGVDAAVETAVGVDLARAMAIGPKQLRGAAVEEVRNRALDGLKEQFQVRFRFGFGWWRFSFSSRFSFSFSGTENQETHSPKGPRRVPLVGLRASGPTAEGAE